MNSLLDKWRLLQAIIADVQLPATAKVAAAVLLDCLNCQTGRCDPSIAFIADRIARGRRQAIDAVNELAKQGWLTRTLRRGTTAYAFAFDRLDEGKGAVRNSAQHVDDDVRKTAPLGVRNFARGGVRNSAHKTEKRETGKREHGKEETSLPPLPFSVSAANGEPPPAAKEPSRGQKAIRGQEERVTAFDAFWRAYPKRVAKGAARRAFDRALKAGASPAEIIAGARRYAAERAQERDPTARVRFTKHPTTWLNGEGWLDEEALPANGLVIDQNGNRVADPPRRVNGEPRRRFGLTDEEAARIIAEYQP
jgi:hypothetical protein